ncbi:TetR/AcrR family transcriptional regulator [Sinomicrobium pectinilyticum]|uniref:TetR/AcrR family transcriptional regulator n=1 Tax=Sinomicrobium pectinilyticum TaxID=1084421 RepID=A0A3N0ERK5_SINP1|nr:TetR/AcrR family transcriptional regulator [Sinomicrobium pectinilyticum]RNL90387.1 TetR/AcrR family transcriptional regulator [Sinomicrobium pectinilyticum]
MRPQKILEEEIIAGLTKVFRAKGYEGASLQELAKITGLKKASLYHRFPEGKQGMALAVITHLDNWVEEHVFRELLDENSTPQLRLKKGLGNINKLYDDGKEGCIFNALSMETGLDLFEEQIKNGMKKWIDTFKEVGVAFNLSSHDAKEHALRNLIEIQGSLIVSKALGDFTIFQDTIQNIENRYLGA